MALSIVNSGEDLVAENWLGNLRLACVGRDVFLCYLQDLIVCGDTDFFFAAQNMVL